MNGTDVAKLRATPMHSMFGCVCVDAPANDASIFPIQDAYVCEQPSSSSVSTYAEKSQNLLESQQLLQVAGGVAGLLFVGTSYLVMKQSLEGMQRSVGGAARLSGDLELVVRATRKEGGERFRDAKVMVGDVSERGINRYRGGSAHFARSVLEEAKRGPVIVVLSNTDMKPYGSETPLTLLRDTDPEVAKNLKVVVAEDVLPQVRAAHHQAMTRLQQEIREKAPNLVSSFGNAQAQEVMLRRVAARMLEQQSSSGAEGEAHTAVATMDVAKLQEYVNRELKGECELLERERTQEGGRDRTRFEQARDTFRDVARFVTRSTRR